MKLCYKFEIKKIKGVETFEALKVSASQAFKETDLKVEQMKFWYLDSDDDVISVSNQADFEEFIEGLQGLQMRLIIAETIDEAKTQLTDGNFKISSGHVTEQSMISNIEMKNNESFDIIQAMETQTDIQMNTDSHSIACGEDSVFDKITSNCATDARDMIKDLVQQKTTQNSFGCNTENFDLVDKPVDAIVETNEIASQCKAQYKDMNSQTKVKTESQGCQKEITMNETGVSCLIIGPEDINQTEVMSSDEDLPDCFRCDGNKVNKKGLPCKKCNGTGKLNNKFFRDLHKILSDEIRKYCTQEYQKLLIQHIEQKRENQNKVVHHNITCDNCNVSPIVGIRYKCTVRQDFDLCESCESQNELQPHLMLKIRDPKHTPTYLMCQFD